MLNKNEPEYLDISSLAVANHFLSKEKHDINNLKLNKLLYITFGWFSGYYDCYLFRERIEAWRFGPVIPSIYHQFKYKKGDTIEKKAIKVIYASEEAIEVKEPKIDDSNLSEKSKKNIKIFIDSVYEAYQKLSPFQLVKLTHDELTPWSRTYKPKLNLEISKFMIYEYYKIAKNERDRNEKNK